MTKKGKLVIAIVSLFRDDSQEYINHYLDQIFAQETPHTLNVHMVEGDSVKPAADWIRAAVWSRYPWDNDRNTIDFYLESKSIGQPYFTSIEHPERFWALGQTANAALERIAREKTADMVLYLDSDLLIPNDLIHRLIDVSCVTAPRVLARNKFYDTWAFRSVEGKRFSPEDTLKNERPFLVSSVGGVISFPAKAVYEGLRYKADANLGLCRDLGLMGYNIWVLPSITVFHPVDEMKDSYQAHAEKYL